MKRLSTLVMLFALTITSFAQQQNLVKNPNFGTGELSPWQKGPITGYIEPTISSINSHSGNYHAKYQHSEISGFYQDIEVNSNTKYTLSFWYKSSGIGFGGRLWSIFLNANNRNVDLVNSAADNPLKNNNRYLSKTDEWKQHIVEFTSPNNIVKLRLAVRSYTNSTISFDDFSLVEGTLSTIDQDNFQKRVRISTIISDRLNLTLPTKSTVNIYDINGQLISSNRVDIGEQFITTASLTKGVYIVSVNDGNSNVTQKVIKK